jgi:hypothetical protein
MCSADDDEAEDDNDNETDDDVSDVSIDVNMADDEELRRIKSLSASAAARCCCCCCCSSCFCWYCSTICCCSSCCCCCTCSGICLRAVTKISRVSALGARSTGALPSMVRRKRLAPSCNSVVTTSLRPARAAQCSGVQSNELGALISAPYLRSNAINSVR